MEQNNKKHDQFPVLGPGLQKRCTWKLGEPAEKPYHISKKRGSRPKIYDNILQAVGRTPLVRLNRIGVEQGFPQTQFLCKCEFINPGGSVKDRIGRRMILDAQQTGKIKQGDLIIEPTSGNTGIGLAMSCAVRGYKCLVALPQKMSLQKIAVLKALGAKIVRTRTEAGFEDADCHLNISLKVNKQTENSHILDQYSNPSNPMAHYDETGEQIWDQCDGKLDYAVLGAGTGGTVTGIARKLKEKNPNIFIIAVDPLGSILAQPQELNKEGVPYQVQGIGYDFIPRVLDRTLIDKWYKCDDCPSLNMARRLISSEGYLCGGSSGSAVQAAMQFCRQQGKEKMKGKRMVILLPDSIRNYLSKHVSPQWMVTHGFLTHQKAMELENQNYYKLPGFGQEKKLRDMSGVVEVQALVLGKCTASQALKIMRQKGLKGIPVESDGGQESKKQFCGCVIEKLMLQSLTRYKFKCSEAFNMTAIDQFPRFVTDQLLLSQAIQLLNQHDFLIIKRGEKGTYKIIRREDCLQEIEKSCQ